MSSSSVKVDENNAMWIESKVDPRDDQRITSMVIIPIPLDQLPADYCKCGWLPLVSSYLLPPSQVHKLSSLYFYTCHDEQISQRKDWRDTIS